ncbi:MAG: DNA polymerase III subunit alpha [Prevotellaceae bacterium]|jgi:DNA polymerase-3 subunit alpha|nr:DNA polymerase III subunit alpha [Prevotellaceae bacterium]
MSQFVHLHVHTQYSVLDGAAPIHALFEKARADGQTALAITDHGNMFGVKDFLKQAKKFSEVKPVVGCEVYVNPEGRHVKRGKEDQGANHLILLAKNLTGYYNLVKLVSYGYIEGFYYKPKIDHELLERYHEGLIACSACIAGEVPRAILTNNPDKAEEIVLWYKQLFGDDYYLEIQRHETSDMTTDRTVYPQQQEAIAGILTLAQKHGIKTIATNDVHFVNADDAEAHDRLICLNTGADLEDEKRMRYTKQEYMKTQAEMAEIFNDIPEAIVNTLEIAGKIEVYDIDNDPIMPDFPLPEGYTDADDYLRFLTLEGAKKRYGEITPDIEDRINFELDTVKNMKFPSYFLIVWDFIKAARDMDVWVGPGRGSAAGSVVAYCLEITDIDPLKYGLLFERFLNPDRISMPDMDIDFDDEGRSKVFKYVEEKYGKDHVSHVITFGTMAAKSAIRDVARVEKLPLKESDPLAKVIPARWDKKTKEGKSLPITIKNCIEYFPELKAAAESQDPKRFNTMRYAAQLEGSIRSTGVHACAILIGRNNLMEHIPISMAKDKKTGEEMWVSQYEGSCIEEVGMLKMDFLGLSTLSILKEAVENIRKRRNITIDINAIPLDDKKTYELFSRGDSVGTFQFESDGMRKWLRELRPNRFEDLIAMNALYRPGPMQYIPDFIACKHGRKSIQYDLPEMEEILRDTYGVTVYQEQVMLLSQKLAGFTKGEADKLRKAMGKKQRSELDKMKGQFIEGATAKGHDEKICGKIWSDWEKFAEYAFNKSHSVCYAWIGYQTAYLKANYPAEYMAAALSINMGKIDEIKKGMDECKQMGIAVLGPDVNESYCKFMVNDEGNIRFALAAIKGVGANAVDMITEERDANGPFKSVFDFVERVNLTAVNRKSMEAMVYAGAFDRFKEITRPQYFLHDNKNEFFIDALLRYGSKVQMDKRQNLNSLFAGEQIVEKKQPKILPAPEHNLSELLKKEKELVGMYLSAHPLDTYRFEVKHFTTHTMQDIEKFIAWKKTGQVAENENNKTEEDTEEIIPAEVIEELEENTEEQKKQEKTLSEMESRQVAVAGIVVAVRNGTSQKGQPWGNITIEDYSGTHSFMLFGKDYESFLQYFQVGIPVLVCCAMQKRWRTKDDTRPEEWEARIKSMQVLDNVKNNVKAITLSLSVLELTPAFIQELTRQAEACKGNTELRIKFIDTQNDILTDVFSRSHRIILAPDILSFFEKENIKFELA